MSDNWQVGDLAVCVETKPIKNSLGGLSRGVFLPAKGVVCVVRSITPALSIGGKPIGDITLSFEGGFYGRSFRFRKIKPDTAPCEEEFTTLIKRMKPKRVYIGSIRTKAGQ